MSKFIGLLMIISAFATLHKFYSSISLVTYTPETQLLQITSRYTIEDVEFVLKQRYDKAIRIEASKDSASWKTYFEDYCKEKFTLRCDAQEISYQLLTIAYEDDLLVCNFEATSVPDFTSFEMSNTLLMEYFEEQQHIIHITKGKQRKTLLLEKEKHKGIVKFGK